jgi:hypothetical protein
LPVLKVNADPTDLNVRTEDASHKSGLATKKTTAGTDLMNLIVPQGPVALLNLSARVRTASQADGTAMVMQTVPMALMKIQAFVPKRRAELTSSAVVRAAAASPTAGNVITTTTATTDGMRRTVRQ